MAADHNDPQVIIMKRHMTAATSTLTNKLSTVCTQILEQSQAEIEKYRYKIRQCIDDHPQKRIGNGMPMQKAHQEIEKELTEIKDEFKVIIYTLFNCISHTLYRRTLAIYWQNRMKLWTERNLILFNGLTKLYQRI